MVSVWPEPFPSCASHCVPPSGHERRKRKHEATDITELFNLGNPNQPNQEVQPAGDTGSAESSCGTAAAAADTGEESGGCGTSVGARAEHTPACPAPKVELRPGLKPKALEEVLEELELEKRKALEDVRKGTRAALEDLELKKRMALEDYKDYVLKKARKYNSEFLGE